MIKKFTNLDVNNFYEISDGGYYGMLFYKYPLISHENNIYINIEDISYVKENEAYYPHLNTAEEIENYEKGILPYDENREGIPQKYAFIKLKNASTFNIKVENNDWPVFLKKLEIYE